MEGKTQETAAAKAGMSVRSARKWQSGSLPSATKPEHRWRTRPDPFDGVWEDEIEPLLRNDPTGKLDFVHLGGVGEDVGELSVNCGWGFSAVGIETSALYKS